MEHKCAFPGIDTYRLAKLRDGSPVNLWFCDVPGCYKAWAVYGDSAENPDWREVPAWTEENKRAHTNTSNNEIILHAGHEKVRQHYGVKVG